MRNFQLHLIKNLKEIFQWPNIVWHLIAIFLTYILTTRGLDWDYFLLTRGMDKGWVWLPAGLIGFIVPVFIPIIYFFLSKHKNNPKYLLIASALTQSVMLGWVISSTYKVFTGRIPPDLTNRISDISNGFQFGIWRGGIFWGWPSSHTTVAFALAVTLTMLYSKNFKVKYLAWLYAIYIGFGASIGFHWFSEIVAGIMIGSLVGFVVGKNFKNEFSNI